MTSGIFDLALEDHSYSRLTLIEERYRALLNRIWLAYLVIFMGLFGALLVYQCLDDHGIAELNADVHYLFLTVTALLVGVMIGMAGIGSYFESAIRKAKKVYTDTLLEESDE